MKQRPRVVNGHALSNTQGVIVYAGVDYAAILAAASEEADVVLFDGGNNDLPFYKPGQPGVNVARQPLQRRIVGQTVQGRDVPGNGWRLLGCRRPALMGPERL